jgi:chromosome segregation ATPase
MGLYIKPPKPPGEVDGSKGFSSFMSKIKGSSSQELERMHDSVEKELSSKVTKRFAQEDKFLLQKKEDIDKREHIIHLKEEALMRQTEQLEQLRSRMDDDVKERKEFLKGLEQEVEQKQELLWEKERLLDKKDQILERHHDDSLDQGSLQKEITLLRGKKEQLESELKTKKAEHQARQEDSTVLKNALQVKEEILEQKENALHHFEKALKTREQDLGKYASNVSNHYAEWTKKIDVCQEEVSKLENQRDALNEDIKIHIDKLNSSSLNIQEKEQELHAVNEDLVRKEKDLGDHETKLKELQGLLQAKEEELNKKEFLLVQAKENVSQEELDHERTGAQLTDRGDEIREHAHMLQVKKDIFDRELPMSLEKLEKIREEWELKESVLREKSSRILADKTEVERMLDKIESNVRILQDKEDNIIKQVDGLSKSKSRLQKEEDRVLAKVRKLETVDRQLKDREKHIQQLERAISNEQRSIHKGVERLEQAREFKKEIPKLEHLHTKLKKQLEHIEDEALAKRELLKNQEEKLLTMARDLQQREARLEHSEERIAKDEEAFEEEREGADEGLFESYVQHEIRRTEHFDEPEESGPYQHVYQLVRKARKYIDTRSLDLANDMIFEIEKAMQEMEDSEKRRLHYDVLELKTDVKLATLS